MKDFWARKEAFILYEFNQMVLTTPLDYDFVKQLKSGTVSRKWNSGKNAWIIHISERDKALEITRQFFDVIEENQLCEIAPTAVAEPIDTISDEKPFGVQEGDKVEIWTHGDCAINPGPGGYAAVLRHNGKVREIVGGYELTTNYRMAMMAVIVALESLKTRCNITIYSDALSLVDPIKSGRAKRLTKRRRVNADLWQRLLCARDKHDVKFRWVNHSSTPENERCNELVRVVTLKSNLPKDPEYEIYRESHDIKKRRGNPSYSKFKDPLLDEIETALEQGQRIDKKRFRTHLKVSHTEAERLMWKYLHHSHLRKGQKGLRFVQQYPVGPYFADFCCLRVKLVVEIDGHSHDGKIEYDKRRDDYMTGHGWLVLRYKNEEVLADIQGVLSKIYGVAIERRNVSTHNRGKRLIRTLKQ